MTSHLGELYRGERVLWSGTPVRYPVFDRRDLFAAPFGLALGLAFALLARNSRIFDSDDPVVVGVSWFFVAVGVYLAIGDVTARYLYNRSARYQITNQRVIVDSTIFGRRNVHSVYLKDLPPPTIKHLNGTVGTITFGSSKARDIVKVSRYGIHIENPELPPVLVEVEDARRVRDLIVAAQTEPT